MTDEQLQAIRERLERRYTDVDLGTKVQRVGDAFTDIAALLAEVERLRATLDAIEEDGTAEHNEAVRLRQKLARLSTND